MSYVYTYATVVAKAKEVQKNIKTDFKTNVHNKWGYYFAKAILTKKPVEKKDIGSAPHPSGDYLSRQIRKNDLNTIIKHIVEFAEKNGRMPNFITWNNKHIRVRDYINMMSYCLIFQSENNRIPNYYNINSKAFTKPTEPTNKVYEHFVKTFGKVTCIDDAMEYIAGRGYGYYYDDHKSNIETIDAIADDNPDDDPNCTDATQMMKNVADGTGKYKSVDCVHVLCRGGDGHVYLRITAKDGTVFYRDPAACLDNGNITSIWCSNGTVLAINPSWWLNNLNR